MLNVLYEDNHVIVAVKPCNVPSQADASGDADMLTAVKGYIKEKYGKPGDVYLGLVHRLDRPVGGVMVFARTSKAAERLSGQFRGHGARKRYAALAATEADGTPYSAELIDTVVKDEATGSARIAAKGTPGGREARLRFTRQGEGAKAGVSLLDVELYTGRHHQIRVQLANAGLPVWGDQRYNSAARPGEQIALWAYSLSFEHPTKKERMTFVSLPEGGAWESWKTELKLMGAGISTVYVDDNVLIADKPVNMESAEADGGADTLEARARAALGEAYAVHRLDRNTTGLIMLARNEEAREQLDCAVLNRDVRKWYRCIVRGGSSAPGELTHYGIKDESRAYLSVYDEKRPGAKELRLSFRAIKTEADRAELEVELITGRTHQIRAQLSHIGRPILGDDKYGDQAFNRAYSRQLPALCAVRLELHFAGGILGYLDGRRVEIPARGFDEEHLR